MNVETKIERLKRVHSQLLKLGFEIQSTDFQRPWGGFFVIDPVDTKKIIYQFYPELAEELASTNLPPLARRYYVSLSQRLSWQYHHRRAELWKLIEGKAAYKKSDTDLEGDINIMEINKTLTLGQGERHRLIGLNEWGIIAEIWQHTDATQPSNEDDIVRLQDDYNR
ncbi:MAG: phosphoheptose isomerase [Saprospiraceae bacterium]|nr:phosphoheptose isomerase [Saprospiraceae bacterium]